MLSSLSVSPKTFQTSPIGHLYSSVAAAESMSVFRAEYDLKKNNITFAAQSPGGTSLASDDFFVSAE